MEYVAQFKQAIKTYLPHIQSWVTTRTDSYMNMYDADLFRSQTVDFIIHWGKRLRPILWLVTALNYSGEQISDDYVYPFLSLEVLHKFFLAHDDILDKDVMRYGKATVHQSLQSLMPDNAHEDPVIFGNSLAMISGDLMQSIAYDYIIDSNCDADTKIHLMKLINNTIKETGYGRYIQFIMDYQPLSQINLDRVIESLICVTWRYTFSFPIKFGLFHAGKPDLWNPDYEQLCDYMGILFQTGDDLIWLFGDPEETGKSDYSDITQGKKTVPILLTYQHASDEQKSFLDQYVGKPDLTHDEAHYVKSCVLEQLHHIRAFIDRYAKLTLDTLELCELTSEQYGIIRGCIEYMMVRDQESNLKI